MLFINVILLLFGMKGLQKKNDQTLYNSQRAERDL